MAHELAAHALAHGKAKPAQPKALLEFHVKQLHDGTHHIAKHDGKGGIKEGSAKHLHEVHAQMEEHMGKANAGEEAMEEKIHPGIHKEVAEKQEEGGEGEEEPEPRMMGGPVVPGHEYMVGERGPERFSPSTPGRIAPFQPRTASPIGRMGGI